MAVYLSVGSFARELGVTTRTVERWIAAKRVTPAWRTLGGHARFTWEQVEALKRPDDLGRRLGVTDECDGPRNNETTNSP
jgi:excisionase family DNA binding protein